MMRARGFVLITPTPSFGGLCLLLIGIWYAAASQSNGAAYLLLFLVASVALVSIPHTWWNGSGLGVTPLPVSPVFAGELVHFRFDVRRRENLRQAPARLWARLSRKLEGAASTAVAWSPGSDLARITLSAQASARGQHLLSHITLETTYPLGFFRRRRRYKLDVPFLVYPVPAGRRELPLPFSAASSPREGATLSGDDFAGLRAYVPGESQRHIDWKAVARGQPLLVKQFAGSRGRDVLLDWNDVGHLPYEERLSQLVLWVIRAEEEHHSYALHLPGLQLPHAHGEPHYRVCLKALALHPPEITLST